MEKHIYYVFNEGKFSEMHLTELSEIISLPFDTPISIYSNKGYGKVWSARLSTGLFGLTSCEAGNKPYASKGYSEIILGVEKEGLNKLVELGFITCPTCRPDKIDGFWQTVQKTVEKKYDISTLNDFLDRDLLPYDARRVEWETILPIIGKAPDRLYVPNNLTKDDLIELNNRFNDGGFKLPLTGFYDRNAPGRFSEYVIPGL